MSYCPLLNTCYIYIFSESPFGGVITVLSYFYNHGEVR